MSGLTCRRSPGESVLPHPAVRRPLVRSLTVLAALATAVALLPAAVAAPATGRPAASRVAAAAAPTIDIEGRGYGHGRGMSQHGARGAALQGRNYRQILGFYYEGVRYEEFRHWVKVLITADRDDALTVVPRDGLAVLDLGNRKTYRLPTNGAKAWRLSGANGNIRLHYYLRGWKVWSGLRGTLTSAAQFQVLNAKGNPVAWPAITVKLAPTVAREYRGYLRLTQQDTVNYLPMNSYLKGVVPAEMPSSWPNPALRSQIIAARSYAVHELDQRRGRYWQLCDTTACQVYGGVAGETSRTNKLVDNTPQLYLTYDGKPAFTQFSASSGGHTADGGKPYLTAKPDPYDGYSGNTVHSWRVQVSGAPLAAKYPKIGSFVRLQILQRDGDGAFGGRVLRARVHGTKGRVDVTGDDVRWALGLRSTLFRLR